MITHSNYEDTYTYIVQEAVLFQMITHLITICQSTGCFDGKELHENLKVDRVMKWRTLTNFYSLGITRTHEPIGEPMADESCF